MTAKTEELAVFAQTQVGRGFQGIMKSKTAKTANV
jgi:hypothetical protein